MSADKKWIPQDASLRWLVPAGTSTAPARLQQIWVCLETGEREWRDVPRVVEGEEDGPLAPLAKVTRGAGLSDALDDHGKREGGSSVAKASDRAIFVRGRTQMGISTRPEVRIALDDHVPPGRLSAWVEAAIIRHLKEEGTDFEAAATCMHDVDAFASRTFRFVWSGGGVHLRDFFSAWQDWCREYGCKPENQDAMYMAMRMYFIARGGRFDVEPDQVGGIDWIDAALGERYKLARARKGAIDKRGEHSTAASERAFDLSMQLGKLEKHIHGSQDERTDGSAD